jgi:hypothetical protein
MEESEQWSRRSKRSMGQQNNGQWKEHNGQAMHQECPGMELQKQTVNGTAEQRAMERA